MGIHIRLHPLGTSAATSYLYWLKFCYLLMKLFILEIFYLMAVLLQKETKQWCDATSAWLQFFFLVLVITHWCKRIDGPQSKQRAQSSFVAHHCSASFLIETWYYDNFREYLNNLFKGNSLLFQMEVDTKPEENNSKESNSNSSTPPVTTVAPTGTPPPLVKQAVARANSPLRQPSMQAR